MMVRALSFCVACVLSLSAADFDLILRNGRVIDGTGNPARFADVAVKDGRIAAVGRVSGSAMKEVDARRLVIAPGFIDVHTHADEIDDLPRGENFLRMGVTTLVLGNCGSSVQNIGDFFRRCEATNISPNIGTLIKQIINLLTQCNTLHVVDLTIMWSQRQRLIKRINRGGIVGHI